MTGSQLIRTQMDTTESNHLDTLSLRVVTPINAVAILLNFLHILHLRECIGVV